VTELSVSVSNVGGIDDMSCTLDGPLAVITGPNASNKTSLLRAIAFGLGTSSIPVKNDATEARVELAIDGERAVRTARATDGGVELSGEPWLDAGDDVERLEQFGCLLEFNDVRQTVRAGGDAEGTLKAPMNIDALERERAEKLERKSSLQDDLAELDGVAEQRVEHEAELDEARERVADLERELDDLRAQQADVSDDGDLVELRGERADLVRQRNEYEQQVADLEEALDRLDERIAEANDELETAKEAAQRHDVEALQARREEIQQDLHEVEDRLDVLQSVLTANREMLDSAYGGALGQDAGLMENSVTCWACGNRAPEGDFEGTVERLQDVVAEDKRRRQQHQPRLEEIEENIEAAERASQRVEEIEARKRDLEQQRTDRAESLSTRREQLSSVRDDLAALDDRLAERESEQQSTASDLAADVESARVDLHAARREVERLESVVADLQGRVEERDRKAALLDDLSGEITALTGRIENMEARLRTSFNEAMDELVAVLGYDEIDRVWLDGSFDLVVAREIDGVTRQDTVDHLSESEREMVGLVLALAGYVAYDVDDIVPVLMMDTMGAFDPDRTADLLAYFAEEAPLVVAALLPDSAEAVADADVDHAVVEPGKLAASS
jgi:DNA repair exonuclease SbcCD ATPase subunit